MTENATGVALAERLRARAASEMAWAERQRAEAERTTAIAIAYEAVAAHILAGGWYDVGGVLDLLSPRPLLNPGAPAPRTPDAIRATILGEPVAAAVETHLAPKPRSYKFTLPEAGAAAVIQKLRDLDPPQEPSAL